VRGEVLQPSSGCCHEGVHDMRRTALRKGFTLPELVIVISLVAILSAYAAAQINVTSFDAEGYANTVGASVRYAQRLAVTQHRTVAVKIAGNVLTLCYTDSACSGGAVHQPPGTDAYAVTAPTGVTIGDETILFSALGRPDSGKVLTITGDVARTVTVEAETGYVH
jgi:MSHA pilin protein MshC